MLALPTQACGSVGPGKVGLHLERWAIRICAEFSCADFRSGSKPQLQVMGKLSAARYRPARGKTFVGDLLTNTYAKARRVHLVLDNLNIHFRKCFDDVLGKRAATKLLRRVEFHYTPKHASWLNMAEIEIGILSRQCLNRRVENRHLLQCEVDAWQQARNAAQRTIQWKFNRQEADQKLSRHYVPKLAC